MYVLEKQNDRILNFLLMLRSCQTAFPALIIGLILFGFGLVGGFATSESYVRAFSLATDELAFWSIAAIIAGGLIVARHDKAPKIRRDTFAYTVGIACYLRFAAGFFVAGSFTGTTTYGILALATVWLLYRAMHDAIQ